MTVTWGEFAEAAPELAALGLAQFARTGLALVGTLRLDGCVLVFRRLSRSLLAGSCTWA